MEKSAHTQSWSKPGGLSAVLKNEIIHSSISPFSQVSRQTILQSFIDSLSSHAHSFTYSHGLIRSCINVVTHSLRTAAVPFNYAPPASTHPLHPSLITSPCKLCAASFQVSSDVLKYRNLLIRLLIRRTQFRELTPKQDTGLL